MKRIKIADLKNRLLQHLREVEHGTETEVTDHGRPIARLVPVRTVASQIRIIPARRPFAELRSGRYPKGRWQCDSLQLLFEERGRSTPSSSSAPPSRSRLS